jgi:hypothetical protein
MARPSASAPVQFAEPRAGASAFDVIRVDNLSKRFGDFWATLFQCFAGIAPATLGVGERDATRVAPDDRKRLLFFVPAGVRPWTDQLVAWTLRFIAGVPPFKMGICLAGT